MTSANRIMKSMGYRTSSYISIVTSLVLATISFFYVYTLASYFRIHIFFFQNRTTFDFNFDYYITTGYIDHIIILTGLFVWLILSLKEKRIVYALVSAMFVSALATREISTNLDTTIEIITLLSLPLCLSLLIYDRCSLFKKKLLNTETSLLYLNYIGIIAGIIGIISVVYVLCLDVHIFGISMNQAGFQYRTMYIKFLT